MRRFTTVLAFATVAFATPVFAQDLSKTVEVTLTERQDPAAAEALYQRIRFAAKSVCAKANPTIYGYPTATSRAIQTCIRETLDDAVSQTGIPALTSLHAASRARETPASQKTEIAAR